MVKSFFQVVYAVVYFNSNAATRVLFQVYPRNLFQRGPSPSIFHSRPFIFSLLIPYKLPISKTSHPPDTSIFHPPDRNAKTGSSRTLNNKDSYLIFWRSMVYIIGHGNLQQVASACFILRISPTLCIRSRAFLFLPSIFSKNSRNIKPLTIGNNPRLVQV